MIANDNRINGRTIDYTKTLEFLAHHLIAPGCRVVLDEEQFEILKAYLSHVEAVGADTNFQLEMCVDYRDAENTGGYSVSWDNDGSPYEDDLIDAIMVDMVQNLGFVAGSIFRERHITALADIDGRIAEIRAEVAAKHNT
ncbi:hypothetical protein ASF69_01790 [Rhizobium sp. Leaf311]|uniref:hypothetical protein n=1 Tax=Rhizobium sp. Leaf311 TaxID=1736332 RepID=UPI000715EC2A|nr:hypothetical protein [Rhizobium sp. Leaf311]KQQ61182.1 hypothetical protein ASF69_01790 [Rhizobium sp. Leaf311]